MAHGPAWESWSLFTHGASNPAVPAGTEMPPIDHWSIGRPHGAPVGLHTSVSLALVAIGDGAEPVTVPSTPLTGGGTDPVTVPSTPLTGDGAEPASVPPGAAAGGAVADGAEVVSVPPGPK